MLGGRWPGPAVLAARLPSSAVMPLDVLQTCGDAQRRLRTRGGKARWHRSLVGQVWTEESTAGAKPGKMAAGVDIYSVLSEP